MTRQTFKLIVYHCQTVIASTVCVGGGGGGRTREVIVALVASSLLLVVFIGSIHVSFELGSQLPPTGMSYIHCSLFLGDSVVCHCIGHHSLQVYSVILFLCVCGGGHYLTQYTSQVMRFPSDLAMRFPSDLAACTLIMCVCVCVPYTCVCTVTSGQVT